MGKIEQNRPKTGLKWAFLVILAQYCQVEKGRSLSASGGTHRRGVRDVSRPCGTQRREKIVLERHAKPDAFRPSRTLFKSFFSMSHPARAGSGHGRLGDASLPLALTRQCRWGGRRAHRGRLQRAAVAAREKGRKEPKMSKNSPKHAFFGILARYCQVEKGRDASPRKNCLGSFDGK